MGFGDVDLIVAGGAGDFYGFLCCNCKWPIADEAKGMKLGIGVVAGNELAAIGNDLAVALECHGQGIPASVKGATGGEGAIGGEVVVKPDYARALRGDDAPIALRHNGTAEVLALSSPDQPSRRFLSRVANDVVVIPIIDA